MTKVSARLAAVGVAMLAITAGPAMAAEAQVSKATSPSYSGRIEDFILVNLAERAWVGGDFKVAFEDGVVTLTGTVPTEGTKARIGRIARDTIGVAEVKNELQVKPMAVTGSAVPDDELARRVARAIASELPGAKAGEDWWFEGWRVEGPDNSWNVVVDAENGRIFIDGDVPRLEIMRKAIDAARQTPGVQSVRSDVELERFHARHPDGPYDPYAYGPYGYPYYAYPYRPGFYGRDSRDHNGIGFLSDADSRRMWSADGARPTVVSGRVTSIDRQTGQVKVQSPAGPMELSLPPSIVAGMRPDSRLSIRLDTGNAASQPAASPATGGDGTPGHTDTR